MGGFSIKQSGHGVGKRCRWEILRAALPVLNGSGRKRILFFVRGGPVLKPAQTFLFDSSVRSLPVDVSVPDRWERIPGFPGFPNPGKGQGSVIGYPDLHSGKNPPGISAGNLWGKAEFHTPCFHIALFPDILLNLFFGIRSTDKYHFALWESRGPTCQSPPFPVIFSPILLSGKMKG